ncbi:hypothetical protein [[Clostridium] aminophilum]|uniref:hypothetical protein n=1 Tax=[Clostridium] aminophilum TaxID=1526 RepID=UPI003325DA37
MFEIIFCIPWIIVASVWGFILLNASARNRAILNDDKLCRNPELVRQAKSTLRAVRIMGPIVIMVLAVMAFVLIHAFFPIAGIRMEGFALAAGGFIFSYIGAALGLVLSGTAEDPKPKEVQKAGRILMFSFMTAGTIVMIVGILICSSASKQPSQTDFHSRINSRLSTENHVICS